MNYCCLPEGHKGDCDWNVKNLPQAGLCNKAEIMGPESFRGPNEYEPDEVGRDKPHQMMDQCFDSDCESRQKP